MIGLEGSLHHIHVAWAELRICADLIERSLRFCDVAGERDAIEGCKQRAILRVEFFDIFGGRAVLYVCEYRAIELFFKQCAADICFKVIVVYNLLLNSGYELV